MVHSIAVLSPFLYRAPSAQMQFISNFVSFKIHIKIYIYIHMYIYSWGPQTNKHIDMGSNLISAAFAESMHLFIQFAKCQASERARDSLGFSVALASWARVKLAKHIQLCIGLGLASNYVAFVRGLANVCARVCAAGRQLDTRHSTVSRSVSRSVLCALCSLFIFAGRAKFVSHNFFDLIKLTNCKLIAL